MVVILRPGRLNRSHSKPKACFTVFFGVKHVVRIPSYFLFVTQGGRATLEFRKDVTQYGICCEVELKISMEAECPKKKKKRGLQIIACSYI